MVTNIWSKHQGVLLQSFHGNHCSIQRCYFKACEGAPQFLTV